MHVRSSTAIPLSTPDSGLRSSCASGARNTSALVTSMRDKGMRELLAGEGAEPVPSTAGDFGKLLAVEVVRWGNVSKATGLQ